ncbi:lipoprotein LipL36 [Leptospira interrogans]|uniref:Lipoprotein LipL36 n=1 Tax=Leptospira interrogans serovar Bataviae TaxID=312175 RepID=A0AAP9WLW4_LEPIR|nr:lipoprotein LipL36 [Leptospira interrogans]QOI52030.1 lipoprotein LipL36 [Leptospira interrogans serovar Bataviae]
MRRNIMKIAAVAALTVALTACKGDDDDDDVVMLALLYLADQTSGNCVTLTKDDGAAPGSTVGDGKPTYTATGSTKPKAACNSIYGVEVIVNNSQAVVDSVKANYQAVVDKANAAGTACKGTGSTAARFQAAINALDTDDIDRTLAGGNGSGCALSGGNAWNLNPLALGTSRLSLDPAHLGKTVYACSSEIAKTTLLASLSAPILSTIAGSVATDMATNLAYKRKQVAVTANNYGWTTEAAAAGRLINVSELTTAIQAGPALVAYSTSLTMVVEDSGQAPPIPANPAHIQTDLDCMKALIESESETTKKIATALYDPLVFAGPILVSGSGFGGTATPAGFPVVTPVGSVITTAQAAEVKEVLFLGLTCRYGDFDEENTNNKIQVGTETNVKINGTCPATYPKY